MALLRNMLRGLFPRYLDELRHTAFLVNDGATFPPTAEAAAGETIDRYMRDPVTVEIDASAAHLVERFLHTPWSALAVVDKGRFVGMINQLEFTETLMRELDLPAA